MPFSDGLQTSLLCYAHILTTALCKSLPPLCSALQLAREEKRASAAEDHSEGLYAAVQDASAQLVHERRKKLKKKKLQQAADNSTAAVSARVPATANPSCKSAPSENRSSVASNTTYRDRLNDVRKSSFDSVTTTSGTVSADAPRADGQRSLPTKGSGR